MEMCDRFICSRVFSLGDSIMGIYKAIMGREENAYNQHFFFNYYIFFIFKGKSHHKSYKNRPVHIEHSDTLYRAKVRGLKQPHTVHLILHPLANKDDFMDF